MHKLKQFRITGPDHEKRDDPHDIEREQDRKSAKNTRNFVFPFCGKSQQGGGKERHIVRVENGLVVEEHISHETQKPLALCEKLIVSCKQPAADGYVLVPFAGSGSECLAAKNLGLPYIGIELNADYVGLIQRRLAAAEPTMIAAVKATTKAAKAKPSKATEGTHLVPQSS